MTNMVRQNALCLCMNNCCENTIPSLLLRCTAVWAALKVSRRAVQRSQILWKSPANLRGRPRSSKMWQFYRSNLVASWMHLPNCRCFQEHLKMLLQRLRALCFAPWGSGSIQKYLEALVRTLGVSGRFVRCFRTNSHFAVAGTPMVRDSDLSKAREPGGPDDDNEDFVKQRKFILEALIYKERIYVPVKALARNKVIRHFLDTHESSHFEYLRTALLIWRDFYWPALDAKIWKFIAGYKVWHPIEAPCHAHHGVNMPSLPPSATW